MGPADGCLHVRASADTVRLPALFIRSVCWATAPLRDRRLNAFRAPMWRPMHRQPVPLPS